MRRRSSPIWSRARSTLHRVLTAFLATLSGSCSSASTRPVVPKGDDGLDHGAAARSRNHEHARHEGHGVVGTHHGFANADAWTNVFDDPARDVWQRPEDVLGALELTPAMIVADVGAGTGYFAVRLARAVSEGEVIATDVEPDMVRYLNERASREQLHNLRAILATQTTSGLAAQSVDRILVVHVWHHLADRVAYARELSAALRPGGKLFVVDFGLTARRGPPMNLRVAPEAIIADLAAAGLAANPSPVALPDQYIVEARRGP